VFEMKRFRAGAVLIAIAMAASAGTASADPPTPGAYQDDDYLGFRNISPPGQNGFVTQTGIFQFLIDGTRPQHNADQLGLYADLVYDTPGVTEADVDEHFKDASFGVPSGQVADTYTPDCAVVSAPSAASEHCDDVVIQRDSGHGIPHIYGADRPGLMFGIGYATAQDRMFSMDVQRHAGRAELSSFLGGSNVGTDRSIWRSAPYTDGDLQEQFDAIDDLYGADGAQVQEDVQNYVDGINQYIAEARTGPGVLDPDSMIPGEYNLINQPAGPDPWRPIDVLSTASLVAGIFGKGGGGEVRSAELLREAEARFGSSGDEVWADFRSAEDEEAPTTVHDGSEFPYGQPPANPQGVALPDPGTVVSEPIVAEPSTALRAPRRRSVLGDLLSLDGASNALLVSGAETQSGTPLAVMGPQVGYYSPGVLIEQDIHAPSGPEGPGIDARGVAFSGANLYVQLGRGQDYAWSATSAGQDITDTFALELCEPGPDPVTLQSDHYLYDGECLPFEVLERENSWTPSTADSTPAGSETLRALRTKLGIVTHRALVGGQPVAYTSLRATYRHEADSAVGFADFNNPDRMESASEFQDSASRIDYTFNWFYADDQDVAYFNSGANPVRAADTDPSLPIQGDPQYVWQNLNPDAVTFDREPQAAHPQVINQDYITSWNNKQAPGFSASDDTFSYGSVHRSEPLDDRILAGIEGSETMTRAELVEAMEDAATVDLRGDKVLPYALDVVRSGPRIRSKKVRLAVRSLAGWQRSGAHRRDPDGDGTYSYTRAIRLMDAWWPRLVQAQFKPLLGETLYDRLQSVMGLDNAPGARGSAYISGWYGYVEKDLRSLLGEPVTDPYSREYCGGGSLETCRKRLRNSLRLAVLNSNPDDLYGVLGCEEGDQQWCFDSIRHTVVGALGQPRIHWVNRPTFQQVVEIQGHR
jgi:acyl-homoserine lactone acylase PvdQ